MKNKSKNRKASKEIDEIFADHKSSRMDKLRSKQRSKSIDVIFAKHESSNKNKLKSNKEAKKASRILNEVHESAKGLFKIGLIDKRKMEKFDLLCLKQVPDYSPSKIKSLRKRYHISQAVLAAVINTSTSTVRKWEIGDKHPSGPSLKLLNILDKQGLQPLIM